jgi:ubiquinone biosynthesis protein Coq4
MLLIDITRAWGSALTHVFSIAMKQQVAPADGIRIYGGSFLPTGIFFLKAAHKHSVGKMLLEQDKCELAQKLKDISALAKLPENSLGRLYYDFYVKNLVNSDDSDFREYLDADKKRPKRPYAKQDFHSNKVVSRFFEQISYQHDLMHILGDHPFTIEGEATVHAFIIPHVRTPAPKLIAIVLGVSQTWVKRDIRVLSRVWKSYQRGRKAKWLYPVDWVQYLDRNIEEIRHEFKISIA